MNTTTIRRLGLASLFGALLLNLPLAGADESSPARSPARSAAKPTARAIPPAILPRRWSFSA